MTIKELKLILDKLPESATIYVTQPRRLINIESLEKIVDMDTGIVNYYIKMQGDER